MYARLRGSLCSSSSLPALFWLATMQIDQMCHFFESVVNIHSCGLSDKTENDTGRSATIECPAFSLWRFLTCCVFGGDVWSTRVDSMKAGLAASPGASRNGSPCQKGGIRATGETSAWGIERTASDTSVVCMASWRGEY